MSDPTPQPEESVTPAAELRRPAFFSPLFVAWLACLGVSLAPLLAANASLTWVLVVSYVLSLLARAMAPRRPRMRAPEAALKLSFPWVALGISFLWVALAIWMQAWGVFARPLGLIAYGANFPWWVIEGEVDRLATSNLLHTGWTHVVGNVTMLLLAGVWLDSRRFLAVLLAGGLVGASVAAGVLSVWPSGALIVGGSTFVYAAFGYWIVARRPLLTEGAHVLCFVAFALNALMSFALAGASWPAHVGGLVAGLALARLPERSALVLGAVYAVALVVSFARVSADAAAARKFAQVARAPETLQLLAEYYWAEAQASGTYTSALSQVRPMVGDGFYAEPPERPQILLRFAELLVMAWQKGITAQPKEGRESCGVIVQARTATAVFCGRPLDGSHVVVWVGDTESGYKRWPVSQ